MRLRTFTAPDMPAAMKMVREALGDGAVIIASEPMRSKRGVLVTAALEDADMDFEPQVFTKPTPQIAEDSSDLRFSLQTILRFHNIPEMLIAKALQKLSDADVASVKAMIKLSAQANPVSLVRLALEKMLSNFFHFAPLQLESQALRIMLVGPPGIGKTLTVAKMATRLTMDKQALAVMTTDNKRAGGIEQLQAFTNILGIPLQVAAHREELLALIKQHPPKMRLLIDTAGCNPYDATEVQELSSYASISHIEPVLVLPAGGDSLETIDAVEAYSVLPVTRILITRADTTRRFGGIVSAAAAHGLGFCNVSRSSSISDTLQPMSASMLADMLIRYQLQST